MIYLRLFFEFFKIGLFTFGGGYAMLPLIKEAVLKYNWLDESIFLDFIGVCESTPGPIAVNFATFVGATQKGILGALCATVGVVLPAFVIIILVASILKRIIKNKYVNAFLNGIKPVIISLILISGGLMLLKAIGYENVASFNFSIKSSIILLILSVLYILYRFKFKKKPNSILVILFSAILGVIVCSL